jgi:predicted nuclease with TOPRIM domain
MQELDNFLDTFTLSALSEEQSNLLSEVERLEGELSEAEEEIDRLRERW